MKHSLLFIVFILAIYFINKIDTCYLNNRICISEFNYSNSVERVPYLNNSTLDPSEKNAFINTHMIYPKGLNGYWNDCKKISKEKIICSFQELVNIPKCTPFAINRYPIENWDLKFFSITVLNESSYSLMPYNNKEIPWMKSQKVNINQEVLCG